MLRRLGGENRGNRGLQDVDLWKECVKAMMKMACQTIVYGNDVIKTTIASILQNVSENGYDGAEIGVRHFYLDRPDYYRELLEKNHLELPAIHIGGDFLNRDAVAREIENTETYIRFAKELGCRYLYLSGVYRENKTADDYHQEACVYTEIGKRVSDSGLILCYHNHNWEFKNGAEGMKILLDEVPAEVMRLVPDVGWVTVGGYDPVQFLQENLDRVEALHFKDFTAENKFTELGTGIVDFKSVFDFIKDKKEDLWISAEQDKATHTPAESSAANAAFLRGLLGR